jgi:hypothetical protein
MNRQIHTHTHIQIYDTSISHVSAIFLQHTNMDFGIELRVTYSWILTKFYKRFRICWSFIDPRPCLNHRIHSWSLLQKWSQKQADNNSNVLHKQHTYYINIITLFCRLGMRYLTLKKEWIERERRQFDSELQTAQFNRNNIDIRLDLCELFQIF